MCLRKLLKDDGMGIIQRERERKMQKLTKDPEQTPKSKIILYPYYAALFGGFAGMCHPTYPSSINHISTYIHHFSSPSPLRHAYSLHSGISTHHGTENELTIPPRINVHDGQTHPRTQDLVRKELDAASRIVGPW